MKFTTQRIGPISVAHPQHDPLFAHGYGRIIRVVYNSVLGVDVTNIAAVNKRLMLNLWQDSVLVGHDMETNMLERLLDAETMGCCRLTFLPEAYDTSVASSCEYVYDVLSSITQQISNEAVKIETVELWECVGVRSTHSIFPRSESSQ